MSDLITHLAVGYVASKALRVKDPRPILIGSVLPDMSTALWKLPGILGLYQPWMWPYLESMATPFLLLFLGGAAAFLMRRPRAALLGVYGGCMLHFGMDLLPKGAGGELLLYPFSMKAFGLDLYWMDGPAAMAIMMASLAVVVPALPHIPRTPIFSLAHWKPALACLLLAAVLPLFTLDRYYDENVCMSQFWDMPQKWDGQEIELAFDLHHGADPDRVKGIAIRSTKPLLPGKLVWLRGVPREHTLYCSDVRNLDKRFKEYGSAAGLAFFILVLAIPPLGGPPPGSPPSAPPGAPLREPRLRLWASQWRKRIDRVLRGGFAPVFV